MGMSIKKRLQGSIYQVLKHNKLGAFSTQYDRKAALFQAAADLVSHGYKLPHIQGLKQKHVRFLVELWQSQQLSIGTIKNRLSHLRTLCTLLKRYEVVPNNDNLNIGKRVYSTNEDKSLKCGQTEHMQNYRIQVQLELQRHFGLRHEECIKIKPFLADKVTQLELQGSWCKGGRPRTVPICTEAQRYWLEEAKKLAGQRHYSLIPPQQTYQQYFKRFYNYINQVGFEGSHGLRHEYAHQRYQELTGWACPAKGGPRYYELTAEQKVKDYEVRLIISAHLGHCREQVTVNYLGR